MPIPAYVTRADLKQQLTRLAMSALNAENFTLTPDARTGVNIMIDRNVQLLFQRHPSASPSNTDLRQDAWVIMLAIQAAADLMVAKAAVGVAPNTAVNRRRAIDGGIFKEIERIICILFPFMC